MNPYYLTNIRIKGHKSLGDTETSFHEGLNVMIDKKEGAEAHFLDFLNECLFLMTNTAIPFYTPYTSFHLQVNYEQNKSYQIECHKRQAGFRVAFTNTQAKVFELPLIKEHFRQVETGVSKELHSLFDKEAIPFVYHKLCTANLPKDLPLLDVAHSIHFSEGTSTGFLDKFLEFTIDLDLAIQAFLTETNIEDSPTFRAFFQEKVQESLSKELLVTLKNLTSIQDVRISPHFEVYTTPSTQEIKNLVLEFLVEENWVSWVMLPDDIQRMFYMICEVVGVDDAIILLEEPELGISSQQLALLMELLQSQAEKKQIILTTHSPQILTTLRKENLPPLI
ncbi:MAG: AAA family ATPase [Bacteroidia bacterium]